jgi:ACS family hexuronate transporter-like MFS transporter
MLRERSTWAVIGAKFWTDGVWWFVLFWMPDYFHRVFGMSQATLGRPIALVFALAATGALTAGSLYPWLIGRGVDADVARKSSMLLFALVVLAMPGALLVDNVWLAALLIGFGLFAHQGFSTSIFGMAADIVPAQRMASVIALGAVAGNLAGMAVIELAGWSLGHGHGYAPMFAYCGAAYLVALGWIQLVMPRLTPVE